jgi:hypothetical protein
VVKIDQYSSNRNSRIGAKRWNREALPSGTTGAAMSDMHYPEWRKGYWEALLEVNPEKLTVRIFDAETAIQAV